MLESIRGLQSHLWIQFQGSPTTPHMKPSTPIAPPLPLRPFSSPCASPGSWMMRLPHVKAAQPLRTSPTHHLHAVLAAHAPRTRSTVSQLRRSRRKGYSKNSEPVSMLRCAEYLSAIFLSYIIHLAPLLQPRDVILPGPRHGAALGAARLRGSRRGVVARAARRGVQGLQQLGAAAELRRFGVQPGRVGVGRGHEPVLKEGWDSHSRKTSLIVLLYSVLVLRRVLVRLGPNPLRNQCYCSPTLHP